MAKKEKPTAKKKPICPTCVEVHGHDTKHPIQCPTCKKIVGCFYHKKGTNHIVACAKKEKAKNPVTKTKQPNPRQVKVLNEMVANGGSFKKAMIKAGYSPAYAKNPKKFRNAASWGELLDDNLPDWLLTEKHLELLDAKTIDNFIFPLAMDDEMITELIEQWGFKVMKIVHSERNNRAYFSIPDNNIILKAVQEGYKIKNRYEPAEDTLIVKRYEDLTDEELIERYNARTNKNKATRND